MSCIWNLEFAFCSSTGTRSEGHWPVCTRPRRSTCCRTGQKTTSTPGPSSIVALTVFRPLARLSETWVLWRPLKRQSLCDKIAMINNSSDYLVVISIMPYRTDKGEHKNVCFNPFTAKTSLGNGQWKCKVLNPYAFLFSALACEKTFIKTHALKIDVIGPENILFAGASVHPAAWKFYRLLQWTG